MSDKKNKESKNLLELEGTAVELGDLQFEVLNFMRGGEYKHASTSLRDFQVKKSAYPQFKIKTDRLFEHAAELIEALESKMNFPNLASMPQSKQDEIFQKISENWDDLKLSMRRIRTIERDLLLRDARSSIYVVRALLFSFVFLLLVYVLNEFSHSFGRQITGFVHESTNLFFNVIDGFGD